MYSFCAMNSFRMSFWIVPDSVRQSAPCFSATARYIAKSIGAGELIVIDVVMFASGIPSNNRSMSASDDDAHATLSDLAERKLVIGVSSHQCREIEGDAEPRAASGEQGFIPLVGLFWRTEPGELAHRPQLSPVAGRVDAADVGEFAGVIEVAMVIEARQVVGRVEAGDRSPEIVVKGTSRSGARFSAS